MQNPTIYSQLKPQFPDQEHLKCPRCDSANTKFCYYNNYNLSQPRHFCKNCRRYWTKGGALRNIPVGGGTRKSAKRSKRSSTPTSTTTTTSTSPTPPQPPVSTSPPPLVPAAPLVMTSPKTSTTPPVTVQAETKGEPFAASMPPVFENYDSILSSGEGQYGHFYDGSNLQLYGFGENGSSDPGAGQPGNGDNINSEGFLNGHHQSNNGEAGIWNGTTNGWPDLAIYTPGSNFQ